jgi:hypothetical protein
MGGLVTWFGRNAEALLALATAVVVGILGIVDILGIEQINNGILLVLAVLATAVLRDRGHRESVESDLNATLQASTAALDQLPARLERIAEIDRAVMVARQVVDEMATVRALSGLEVGRTLAKARSDTDQWIFKGGTGTYIRAVTLPECVHNARRAKRDLKMRLEIIDPTDDRVCDTYARFRRSLSNGPDGTGETWTFARTRNEAYATILAAAWYEQRFNLLDVDVRLTPFMTTFRWDLSSRYLVITQEDPNAPTMLVEQGRSFFNYWKTELKLSLDQARRIPMERAGDVPLSEAPEVDEVRALFARLDVPLPDGFSDESVHDIIERSLRAKNPYRG